MVEGSVDRCRTTLKIRASSVPNFCREMVKKKFIDNITPLIGGARGLEENGMFDIVAALESQFDEVHYLDFYRDIFPEGSFEERGVYEDGKYNGIAVTISKGSKRAKRLTVTDDLDAITDMAASDDFCLMSL